MPEIKMKARGSTKRILANIVGQPNRLTTFSPTWARRNWAFAKSQAGDHADMVKLEADRVAEGGTTSFWVMSENESAFVTWNRLLQNIHVSINRSTEPFLKVFKIDNDSSRVMWDMDEFNHSLIPVFDWSITENDQPKIIEGDLPSPYLEFLQGKFLNDLKDGEPEMPRQLVGTIFVDLNDGTPKLTWDKWQCPWGKFITDHWNEEHRKLNFPMIRPGETGWSEADKEVIHPNCYEIVRNDNHLKFRVQAYSRKSVRELIKGFPGSWSHCAVPRQEGEQDHNLIDGWVKVMGRHGGIYNVIRLK